MAQMPRILKNFNLFVNGRGKAGLVEEITLPDIKLKTDGFRAGGMDAETDLDMGTESMSSKFKLADPDPTTLALVGLSGGNTARVVAKGAYRRDSDGALIAVEVEMVGRLKSRSPDAWKSGEKALNEFEMSLNYYRETVGGRTVFEIDVENMIRAIDGVDQLAAIRNAIGA